MAAFEAGEVGRKKNEWGFWGAEDGLLLDLLVITVFTWW